MRIPRRFAAERTELLLLLLATTAAVGLGRELAHGHARMILAAVCACLLGVFWQRGLVIGLLVLVAMNGVPGVDTSASLASRLTREDAGVVVLLLLGTLWALTEPRQRLGRTAAAVMRLAILLLGWWVIDVLRSSVIDHVSMIRAAAFGRQYLYFALLLLVLPRVRLSARDRTWMLRVLVAGALAYAFGQILASLNIVQLTSLIHPNAVATTGGLTRIYSYMIYLVIAGVALGVAAVLVGGRGVRRAALPITAVLLVSVIVQQGRVLWTGLIAGVLFTTFWLNSRADGRILRRLRGRGVTIFGLLVATIGIALVADGGAIVHGALLQRVASGLSALENNEGTVGVRTHVASAMFSVLGGRWPIGVGFIPTSAHYFNSLPNGSLFDPDIGVVNALMTIGVIGALLIYAVMMVCLREALSWLRVHADSSAAWLRYGIAIWIIATILSSITITTLFVTSGVVLSAVMIALLLTWARAGESDDAGLATTPATGAVGELPRHLQHPHAPWTPRRRGAMSPRRVGTSASSSAPHG